MEHTDVTLRRPWWQLHVQAGALEALKWLALGLMVVDHVNAYLYSWRFPLLFAAGRLAFPLFGFVLAYNLARPDNAAADRAFARLTAFGLAAQFFSMSLRRAVMPEGAWWQLNVLLTFAVAVVLIQATRGGARWYTWVLIACATLVAGALVEFHWCGLLYVLAAYHYCSQGTPATFAAWLASVGALTLENGNAWALAALPLLFLFAGTSPNIPRLKWVFYAFYPLHLAGLWLLTRF